MEAIDIARALDIMIPAAKYRGSLTKNDKAAFDAIIWADDRPKPVWGVVQACMVGPGTKYHSWNGSGWTITSEDQTLKDSNEAESLRIAEHETEKSSFTKKTLTVKEQWVKDRLNETTLDNPSKIAIGKIFRKLISFTD